MYSAHTAQQMLTAEQAAEIATTCWTIEEVVAWVSDSFPKYTTADQFRYAVDVMLSENE